MNNQEYSNWVLKPEFEKTMFLIFNTKKNRKLDVFICL